MYDFISLLMPSVLVDTNSLPTVINSLGQIAISVTAIISLCWAVFRFVVLKPLDKKIAEATKQIQPGANGGQSLTDVNKKVDRMADAIDGLTDRIDRIEERNIKIYEHLVDLANKPLERQPRKRSKKENEDLTE